MVEQLAGSIAPEFFPYLVKYLESCNLFRLKILDVRSHGFPYWPLIDEIFIPFHQFSIILNVYISCLVVVQVRLIHEKHYKVMYATNVY